MKKPPDRVLFSLMVKMEKKELQRKLLSVRDRDLAAAVTYFSEFEKGAFYSIIGEKKAEKVREAIQRDAAISYSDYRKIAESLIRYLLSDGRPEAMPDSWFRPGKR